MRNIILYRKLTNRLFQSCVKKVSFILILFVLGMLTTFAIASNTYTGKYILIDGVISTDFDNDSVLQITVETELVRDIVKENNIKWYVSADNVRHKAVIKEIHYNEEGSCTLILKPMLDGEYKISTGDKVYIIIMYGRNYIF